MEMSSGSNRIFGAADLLVALLMTLLWGMNLIVVKVALTGIGPIMTGLVRLFVTLLLTGAWLRPVPGKTLTLVLVGVSYGMIFSLSSMALYWSDNLGALAIANQLSVPIAVLLGVLVLGERLTRLQSLGITLAVGGVAGLVFDPRVVQDLSSLALMTLNSAALAWGSLLQRRLVGVPVRVILAWSGLVGSMTLAPLALIMEPDGLSRLQHLQIPAAASLAFASIASTVIAPGCMMRLLQRHDVSIVMPISLFSTVVTLIAAHLILAAPLTPMMLASGAIVLVGLFLIMRSTKSAGTGLRTHATIADRVDRSAPVPPPFTRIRE